MDRYAGPCRTDNRLAAMPVGVNAYLFGVRYQAGEAETATAIVLSSILSVATLSAVLVRLDAAAR